MMSQARELLLGPIRGGDAIGEGGIIVRRGLGERISQTT